MSSICSTCRRRTCEKSGKPCKRVERILPSITQGALRGERLLGLDIHGNGFDPRRRIIESRRAILDALEEGNSCFKGAFKNKNVRRVARVAALYWWEGLTAAQVGKRVGISESAVCRYLRKVEALAGGGNGSRDKCYG